MDLSRINLATGGVFGEGVIWAEWPPNQYRTYADVHGGGPQSFNDRMFAYMRTDGADGTRLEARRLDTDETYTLYRGDFSDLRCGAGQWQVRTPNGYRSSKGDGPCPLACPLATDDESGDFLFIIDGVRQRGVGAWNGPSFVVLIPDTDPRTNIVGTYRDREAVFSIGDDWYRWTRADGVLEHLCTLSGVLGLESSRGWHQTYQPGRGIVVLPYGKPEAAIVVSADAFNFKPKLRRITEGGCDELHILVSRGDGEFMGERRRHAVDLAARTVNGVPYETVNLRVPPVEEIRVPTFLPTMQHIGVGILGQPGGIDLQDNPDGPLLPGMIGFLYTINAASNTPDTFPAFYRRAKSERVPIYAYWDGPTFPIDQVPSADGVTIIATQQAYPLTGETSGQFDRRIRPVTKALRETHRVALMGATYRQIFGDGTYNLGEQQVLDSHVVDWDIARTEQCEAVFGFHWDRGPQDGAHAIPSFVESFTRMQAASGDASHFPSVETPEPEPPTPNPEPDWIPTSGPFGDDSMQKQWKAGLNGLNGLFYRFAPDLVVGSGGSDVPFDATNLGPHEELIMRKEDDGSFSFIAKALSEKHGRDVYVSSGDASPGVIQTRFERNADETFWVVQTPTGHAPQVIAWSPHRRSNPAVDFAPTALTVDVREAL